MDKIFREAIADLQVITAGTTLTQHYLTVLTAVAQLAQGLCMANLSAKSNLHLHYLQQTKLGVDCGAKKTISEREIGRISLILRENKRQILSEAIPFLLCRYGYQLDYKACIRAVS